MAFDTRKMVFQSVLDKRNKTLEEMRNRPRGRATNRAAMMAMVLGLTASSTSVVQPYSKRR